MTAAKVFKAHDVQVLGDLGLVIGKSIVSTENGEDHYDLQGDHIPLAVAVKAHLDFFSDTAVHKCMHEGAQVGTISGWLPITDASKKSLGIECNWEGVAIVMQPLPDVLKKYEDGTYKGFSIGGQCAYVPEENA